MVSSSRRWAQRGRRLVVRCEAFKRVLWSSIKRTSCTEVVLDVVVRLGGGINVPVLVGHTVDVGPLHIVVYKTAAVPVFQGAAPAVLVPASVCAVRIRRGF